MKTEIDVVNKQVFTPASFICVWYIIDGNGTHNNGILITAYNAKILVFPWPERE